MLTKDQDTHRKENSRIMKENVTLLQEINDLKKEEKILKQMLEQDNNRAMQKGDPTFNSTFNNNPALEGVHQEMRGLDSQIQDIQRQIEEYENVNHQIR